MSTAALKKEMDSSTTHPWSDALRLLSDLNMSAAVLRVSDFSAGAHSIARINETQSANALQIDVAENIAKLMEKIEIIGATSAFTSAIDASDSDKLSERFRERLGNLSVLQSQQSMVALLAGAGGNEFSWGGAIGGARLKFTIQSRTVVNDIAFIIVTSRSEINNSWAISQSNRLRQALDDAVEFAALITLNGKVDFMNRCMSDISGTYEPGEQHDISEIMSPESAVMFAEISTLVSGSTTPWVGSLEFKNHKSKGTIPVFAQVSVMRDPSDHSVSGYCVIGYRKDSNNPLTTLVAGMRDAGDERQRLALVGKISGHIIHEINNPVTVINGKAEKIQWLVAEMPKTSPGQSAEAVLDCANKILAMTDRINNIIRGVKNMSRNTKGEAPAQVRVSDVMSEVRDLVDIVARKKGVTLTVAPVSGEVRVKIQRLRVSQVLVNLLNNAVDAVASLETRNVGLVAESDGDWLCFKVSDSGTGIPPEVKERLFEDYFTTKGSGQGTGIGLTLSRQIAREHGGDLYLDESAGHTCFVLRLPMDGVTDKKDSHENWEEI